MISASYRKLEVFSFLNKSSSNSKLDFSALRTQYTALALAFSTAQTVAESQCSAMRGISSQKERRTYIKSTALLNQKCSVWSTVDITSAPRNPVIRESIKTIDHGRDTCKTLAQELAMEPKSRVGQFVPEAFLDILGA